MINDVYWMGWISRGTLARTDVRSKKQGYMERMSATGTQDRSTRCWLAAKPHGRVRKRKDGVMSCMYQGVREFKWRMRSS